MKGSEVFWKLIMYIFSGLYLIYIIYFICTHGILELSTSHEKTFIENLYNVFFFLLSWVTIIVFIALICKNIFIFFCNFLSKFNKFLDVVFVKQYWRNKYKKYKNKIITYKKTQNQKETEESILDDVDFLH